MSWKPTRPTTGEATDDDGVAGPWTPLFLADLRTRRNPRRAALVAALLVGLVAVWVHWIGLVVAGALVGLVSRTLPRALAAGVGVGALVLVLHVLGSPVMGPAEFLALSPVSYVTVVAAVGGPLWGSLARGVI